NPAQILTLARLRRAAEARHEPDVEPHTFLGIGVHELEARLRRLDDHAELLVELADERRERFLRRPTFTAWKLPPAGELLARGPRGHEPATLGIAHEGDDDVDFANRRVDAAQGVIRGGRDTACTSCPSRTGTAN